MKKLLFLIPLFFTSVFAEVFTLPDSSNGIPNEMFCFKIKSDLVDSSNHTGWIPPYIAYYTGNDFDLTSGGADVYDDYSGWLYRSRIELRHYKLDGTRHNSNSDYNLNFIVDSSHTVSEMTNHVVSNDEDYILTCIYDDRSNYITSLSHVYNLDSDDFRWVIFYDYNDELQTIWSTAEEYGIVSYDSLTDTIDVSTIQGGDSDHDGVLDVDDSAPNNPCIPSGYTVACLNYDPDNDGFKGNSDPDNNDPCIPDSSSLSCTANLSCEVGPVTGQNPEDEDGDGLCYGIDPNDTWACIPNMDNEFCDYDEDGSMGNVDPDNEDPCTPDSQSQACITASNIDDWSVEQAEIYMNSAINNESKLYVKPTNGGSDIPLVDDVVVNEDDRYYQISIIRDSKHYFKGKKIDFVSSCYKDGRLSSWNNGIAKEFYKDTYLEGVSLLKTNATPFHNIDWSDGQLNCPVSISGTFLFENERGVSYTITKELGTFIVNRSLTQGSSFWDLSMIDVSDKLPEPLGTLYSVTFKPFFYAMFKSAELIHELVFSSIPVLRVVDDILAPAPQSVVYRPSSLFGLDLGHTVFGVDVSVINPNSITVSYRQNNGFYAIITVLLKLALFFIMLRFLISIVYTGFNPIGVPRVPKEKKSNSKKGKK